MFERLGISLNVNNNKGKRILIIGASGGVGSIATQLANYAGLTVIGTASRPETVEWAKAHGASYTIDHHKPFAPQLKQLGFDDVDYIFCLNSTEKHWDDMVEVIAPLGKIASIVGTSGPVNLSALTGKSVVFAWELMFTRARYQTPDMIEQHNILNRLAQLVDEGKIQSTLTEKLEPITAANLREAHKKVESGKMVGKIVLANFPF